MAGVYCALRNGSSHEIQVNFGRRLGTFSEQCSSETRAAFDRKLISIFLFLQGKINSIYGAFRRLIHFAFLLTKCIYGFCVILAMNSGLKGTGKYCLLVALRTVKVKFQNAHLFLK